MDDKPEQADHSFRFGPNGYQCTRCGAIWYERDGWPANGLCRPAPPPQEAPADERSIKSLKDRIIEGELELDGTHPPTLMFLMAEHWKAVASEHRAKAKDYDRLKLELKMARASLTSPPKTDKPLKMALEALTAMRHRAEAAEERLKALEAEAKRLEWLRANLHWDGYGFWLPDVCIKVGEFEDPPTRDQFDAGFDSAIAGAEGGERTHGDMR